MDHDPNKGSNLGWYMLAGVLLLCVLFALTAENLCGVPERWKKNNDPGSSPTRTQTPDASTPAGGDG